MRKVKYKGVFHYEGYQGEKLSFELVVRCSSFIEAFILLTAEAISKGMCYQLSWITSEDGGKRKVGDLVLLNKIIE